MGKTTVGKKPSFGYRNVFIVFGLVFLIVAYFRCEKGIFLSSLMFVMPHMEDLFGKATLEKKESDPEKRKRYKALFFANIFIAIVTIAGLLTFTVDVTTKELVTEQGTRLFKASLPFSVGGGVELLWCIINSIFIWGKD